MQKRYAWFYSIGAVSSAFVGILAFGLMQMDGIAGLGGWRWIFIIEGIVSIPSPYLLRCHLNVIKTVDVHCRDWQPLHPGRIPRDRSRTLGFSKQSGV